MTYHTPELLLIGAAANLVLDDSGVPKTQAIEPGICEDTNIDEVSGPPKWQIPGNW